MDRGMKFLITALALGILTTTVGTAEPEEEGGGPPPPPPARKVPALNAEDLYPKGCVDCHVIMQEPPMDVRLSPYMAKWREEVEPKFVEFAKAASEDPSIITGVHPEAADSLKDIPHGCLKCHGKDSTTAPPFARLLHLIHFTGGDENPYMTFFQGECTHCHKLNAKSGEWSIPSAPEP